MLYYVGLPTFQPPPQGVEISLDLLLRDPSLFFSIGGDLDSQVFYFFPTLDSRYLFHIFGSEDLRLLLVEAEVEVKF